MNREFLTNLELDKEVIDKIMAEHGKVVNGYKEEKENLSKKISTYEEEINKLKENSTEAEDWKSKFEELDAKIQKQEAEAKAKAEDDALTQRIVNVFGEKAFINELTKKAMIGEMKSAIKDEKNVGKSDSEIFEMLTKDQENLFVNPNTPAEIPSMGNGAEIETAKEMPTFW